MIRLLPLLLACLWALPAMGQQGFSAAPAEPAYEYRACLGHGARVYDGDTIMDLSVDLGFNVWIVEDFRLAGIDAPEVRGAEREAGLITRDWLKAQLDAAGGCFLIRTYDKGKYGRWIAEVFVDGRNLNAEMVTLGLAEVY